MLAEFSDVFDNEQLKTMCTQPVKIQLKADAVPFRVSAARPVPFAYREQIKKQLDTMEAQNVIQPVTEHSEWCHPVVLYCFTKTSMNTLRG